MLLPIAELPRKGVKAHAPVPPPKPAADPKQEHFVRLFVDAVTGYEPRLTHPRMLMATDSDRDTAERYDKRIFDRVAAKVEKGLQDVPRRRFEKVAVLTARA